MESHRSALSLLINIHKRLALDSFITPYKCWCDWVHSQSFPVEEKWSRLLAWTIDPSEYDNSDVFKSDWQLFKLLSKLSLGSNPTEGEKDVAEGKFLASEQRCQAVNELLRGRFWTPGLEQLLPNVQKIVATVLGDVDDFLASMDVLPSDPEFPSLRMRVNANVDRWDLYYRATGSSLPCTDDHIDFNPDAEFGPGISVGGLGDDDKLSSISEKIVLGTLTQNLVWAQPYLSRMYGFENLRIVRGSRLTFVPKRVGEARAICYEPSMNMLIQKQIGRHMKRRLKAFLHIDLTSQQKNRQLAKFGAVVGNLCTVDLSSASDLFAIEFVRNALPHKWFCLLDACRSQQYLGTDGEWHTFEKFSTMGNGFTFELESLLFAAIAKAAVTVWHAEELNQYEFSVFGDDLIFPSKYYHTITQALTICGHIPNLEKSFYTGPFRESCGGDFFRWRNVTPFKIKDIDLERPTTIVNIYNGLFASSREDSSYRNFSPRYDRCLAFIKAWLVSRYPRLSEGPVELEYNGYIHEHLPIPSNRWIWSEQPNGLVFSKRYQALVPKYLLLETSTPAVRYIPAEGKVVEMYYDVHPLAAGYYCSHGGEIPSIWEMRSRFSLNPALRSEITTM